METNATLRHMSFQLKAWICDSSKWSKWNLEKTLFHMQVLSMSQHQGDKNPLTPSALRIMCLCTKFGQKF